MLPDLRTTDQAADPDEPCDDSEQSRNGCPNHHQQSTSPASISCGSIELGHLQGHGVRQHCFHSRLDCITELLGHRGFSQLKVSVRRGDRAVHRPGDVPAGNAIDMLKHPSFALLGRQRHQRRSSGRRHRWNRKATGLQLPATQHRQPIHMGVVEAAEVRLGIHNRCNDPRRRHRVPRQQRRQAINTPLTRFSIEHRNSVPQPRRTSGNGYETAIPGGVDAQTLKQHPAENRYHGYMMITAPPSKKSTYRNWRAATLILVGCALAAPTLADLQDDVGQAIRIAGFEKAIVAVSVREAQTREPIVSINDRELMIPASNMKLLTTGTALHVLGPDFEFKTKLLRDGERLIVVGDGDPAFGDPDLLELMQLGEFDGLDVEQFVNLWVDSIVKADIKHFNEIVVDDRIFDREFVHQDWPVDQLNRRYCAQVAGLNFHRNVLQFFPRHNQDARPDIKIFRPHAPWLEVINRGTTRQGPSDRDSAWVARKLGTNDLTFHGNIKGSYREPVPVTVHDMPSFFAQLLADRLRNAGVEVSLNRTAEAHEPASNGQPIGPMITTPISTIVTRCNRDSQNLYAEALIKRVGYTMTNEPGSWLNGAAIVRLILHERIGDPNLARLIVVSDGSGLSRKNRVAAATVTAWLQTFLSNDRTSEVYVQSLAVGGKSGTLRNRFRNIDLHGAVVHGKSGYIKHVSCLSGYVITPDGRQRSFSILVNGLTEPDAVSHAKKMQERIVAAIAWDMAPAVVQVPDD